MPSVITLHQILSSDSRPALLIGNGINRFGNSHRSSWDELLEEIAARQGVHLKREELQEMSNTERFDILDLGKPKEDRTSLQKVFCDQMRSWEYGPHHERIVSWAIRNSAPIITVNFDENLSRSVDARLFRQRKWKKGRGFTAFYPWETYFSYQEISNPGNEFAIWHAHGMMCYSQSIRLGLTHYMGSVHRARQWIYRTDTSLVKYADKQAEHWPGVDTWLHAFFFSDIAIFGFDFGKDETFMRWLFLERARLFKRFPDNGKKTWFIVKDDGKNNARKAFFQQIGVEFVVVDDYRAIYESNAWD